MHDEVLRTGLSETGGIEVMTEGDAFTVAFTDPVKAVEWCLLVQHRLMEVTWPAKLASSGNESSSTVTVQGTHIFTGLRVRMGIHFQAEGATQLSDGSPATTSTTVMGSDLLKTTRVVSDFALGGQVLASNQVMAAVQGKLDPHNDVAAIGNVTTVEVSDDAEDEALTDTVSVVQLLPNSLKKRLPEFIVMYSGHEDQVRPPVGECTFVFTYCHEGKKLEKEHSQFADQLRKVDETIVECAERWDGYECKGGQGKYLFVFATADQAIKWSHAVLDALMEVQWAEGLDSDCEAAKLRRDPATGKMIFKGLNIAVGMNTGVPTMFNFNKSSGKMDYFGQVVNRCARIMSTSAPGEISASSRTLETLSEAQKGVCYINSRGLFNLKGVSEELEVHTVLPKHLEARTGVFEELRATEGVASPSSMMTPLSPEGDKEI